MSLHPEGTSQDDYVILRGASVREIILLDCFVASAPRNDYFL